MIKDIMELLLDQEREILSASLRLADLRARSAHMRTLLEQRLAEAEKAIVILNEAVTK